MKSYPIEGVEIVKMIKISFLAGKGTSDDLFRIVTKYYDLEGNCIVTVDPIENS